MADGKYIWIAESDDYADVHFLARLVPLLEADPRLALAYCRSQCVSAEGNMLGFADSIYFPDLDPLCWTADFHAEGREECETHFFRFNTVVNASAAVFRKAFYNSIGGADESFRLCGDWKLWAGMALRGTVAYMCQPLNWYRFHPGTVRNGSQYDALWVVECLRVLRWLLGQVSPTDTLKEKVCDFYSDYWVAALLSTHVTSRYKFSILRDIGAIDPHPLRRALRPALNTARLKIRRHFHISSSVKIG